MDLQPGGSEGEEARGGGSTRLGCGTETASVGTVDSLHEAGSGEGERQKPLQTPLSAPLYFSLPLPLFPCAAPSHFPAPSTLSGLVSTAEDFASWGVSLESLAAATFRASLLELSHTAYLPSRPRLMWRRVKRRLRADGLCWGAEAAEDCGRKPGGREEATERVGAGGTRGAGTRLHGHCFEDGRGGSPEKEKNGGSGRENEFWESWGRSEGCEVTEMMKQRELLLEDVCSRFFMWFYVDASRKMITDGLSLARRRLPVDWVYRHYGALLNLPESHFDVYPPYCIPISHERTTSSLGDVESEDASSVFQSPASDSLSEVSDAPQEAEPEGDGEAASSEASLVSPADNRAEVSLKRKPEEAGGATAEEIQVEDTGGSAIEAPTHTQDETSGVQKPADSVLSDVHTPEDPMDSGVAGEERCSLSSLVDAASSSSESVCDPHGEASKLHATDSHEEDSDVGDTENSFPLSGACPARCDPVDSSAVASSVENASSSRGASDFVATPGFSPSVDGAGTSPFGSSSVSSPPSERRISSPLPQASGEALTPDLLRRGTEMASPCSFPRRRPSDFSALLDSPRRDELSDTPSGSRQIHPVGSVFSPSYADFSDLRAAVSREQEQSTLSPADEGPAGPLPASPPSCDGTLLAGQESPDAPRDELLSEGPRAADQKDDQEEGQERNQEEEYDGEQEEGDSSTGSVASTGTEVETREEEKDDFLVVLSESEFEEGERMQQLAATMRRSLQMKGCASVDADAGRSSEETEAEVSAGSAGLLQEQSSRRSCEAFFLRTKNGGESTSGKTKAAEENETEDAADQEGDLPIVERSEDKEEGPLEEEQVGEEHVNEETESNMPDELGADIETACSGELRLEGGFVEKSRRRGKQRRRSGLSVQPRRSARVSGAAREKSASRDAGRLGCVDSEKREAGGDSEDEGGRAGLFLPSSSENVDDSEEEGRERVAALSKTRRRSSRLSVVYRQSAARNAVGTDGGSVCEREEAHAETGYAVLTRASKRRKTNEKHEHIAPDVPEERTEVAAARTREEIHRRRSTVGVRETEDGACEAGAGDEAEVASRSTTDQQRGFLESDSVDVVAPQRHFGEEPAWLGTDSEEDSDSSPATSKRTVDLLSPPPSPPQLSRPSSLPRAAASPPSRVENLPSHPEKTTEASKGGKRPRASPGGGTEVEETAERITTEVGAGPTRPLFPRFSLAHTPTTAACRGGMGQGTLRASSLQAQMKEIFGSEPSQIRRSFASARQGTSEETGESGDTPQASTLHASGVDLGVQHQSSDSTPAECLLSRTEEHASVSAFPRCEAAPEGRGEEERVEEIVVETVEEERELRGEREEEGLRGDAAMKGDRRLEAVEQRGMRQAETKIPRFPGYSRLQNSGKLLRGNRQFAQRYLEAVDARLEAIETQLAAAKLTTDSHRPWRRPSSFGRLCTHSEEAKPLKSTATVSVGNSSSSAAGDTPQRACRTREDISVEPEREAEGGDDRRIGEAFPQLASTLESAESGVPATLQFQGGCSSQPSQKGRTPSETQDKAGPGHCAPRGRPMPAVASSHRDAHTEDRRKAPCRPTPGARTGLQKRRPPTSATREASPFGANRPQPRLPGARPGVLGKPRAPPAEHAPAAGQGAGAAASRGVCTPGAHAASAGRSGSGGANGRGLSEKAFLGTAETPAPDSADASRQKRTPPLPRVALLARRREEKLAPPGGADDRGKARRETRAPRAGDSAKLRTPMQTV
ncbi:hypothetical protein TGRUB_251560 [Toxoplasma gondii RUB]|uniref:Uncharacterized protein n=1 Tax=Toxoplasma gondii RUB TaxID=935652 RepID=A0A086LM04_TOXGO|nr:hypothetical protein TGRUB_251560 [Toxoplasma gondii RUB]